MHEHAQGGPSGFRGMLCRSPAPHLLPPEYAGQFHGWNDQLFSANVEFNLCIT